MSFVTKTSGSQDKFSSGAHRDKSTGKPRYDLLPLKALHRWADLMGRGALHYGDRNWEKGMPATRFSESALRHFFQYMEGDRTEDHLAAVLFNIGSMIHFENGQWDDINGEEEAYVEWVLEVEPETDSDDENVTEHSEYVRNLLGIQLELPFYTEPAPDLINWESLKREVDEGRTEKGEVNWPEGHPYYGFAIPEADEG